MTSFGMAIPVHPHRRGERAPLIAAINAKDGSSPQAWGTLGLIYYHKIKLRFIPTGVGNALLIQAELS